MGFLWLQSWGPKAENFSGWLREPQLSLWGNGTAAESPSQKNEGWAWQSMTMQGLARRCEQRRWGQPGPGRRGGERKEIQLRLQADVDSNRRGAKRCGFSDVNHPKSLFPHLYNGPESFSVTPQVCPCPCHRGVYVWVLESIPQEPWGQGGEQGYFSEKTLLSPVIYGH